MCENPWKKCDKPGCHVIILYKGQRKEICEECWIEIADSELEWSNDSV